MVRLPDAAGQVRNAPVKAIRGLFAGIGQLLLAADRFRAEEAERERADDEQHDPLTTPVRQPAGRDGQPAEPRRFRSLDSTGNVRLLTPDEAAEASPEAVPPQADATTQADLATQADTAAPAAVPAHAGAAPAAVQPAAVQSTAAGRPRSGKQAAQAAQAAVAAVPAARIAPRVPAAVSQPSTARQPGAAAHEPTARQEPAPGQAAAAAQTPSAAQAPADPPSLPVPGYDGLSLPSLRSRLRVLDAAQLRVLVDYEKANAKRTDVVTMFERRIAKLEAAGPHAT